MTEQNNQQKGFISSMITVGWYTLLYRFSSVLRDILMATTIGAGVLSDAFAMVFKLANILRKVFSEGAFNASFLPKFTHVLKEDGKLAAQQLASQIFTWLTIVLTIFTVICLIYFDKIIDFYAPTFIGTPKYAYAIELGRICFPYVMCSFLVALFSGILNSVNKFALPAGSHLMLNIFIIISLFCGTLSGKTLVHNVAISVFIAGISQTAILWLSSYRNGFKVTLTTQLLSGNVKEIFRKMIPGAIGAGVWQLNMFIDISMCSQLATGCVSYLYYMDHINQFPIGIIGISLTSGMLPYITRSLKEQQFNNASYQINRGMIFSLACAMPISIISIFIPETITSLFYEGGKFTHNDVINAAPCLRAFAIGLPAYTITKICSTAFFAQKATRTPLISGIFAIIINYIGILLFMHPFQHTGIAFATTIAAWFNGVYLYIALIRQGKIAIYNKSLFKILKQLILSIVVGWFAYNLDLIFAKYYTSKFNSVSLVFLLIGICVTIYYLIGKKFNCFNENAG